MDEERAAVIKEAMEWIGTPYVPNARVKGINGGCDCLTFLAGAYEGAGIIDRLPIPHYDHDWHLHQKGELYLNGKDDTPGLLHFCDVMPDDYAPQPADIIVWKFGQCYSHSAIVVKWPQIIHAWWMRPVALDDVDRRTVLNKIHEVIALRNTPRPRMILGLKRWQQ